MARAKQHLSRGETILAIAATLMVAPVHFGYEWLSQNHPIGAFSLRIAFGVLVIGFFAALSCLTWYFLLSMTRWPANQFRKTFFQKCGLILQHPIILYMAITCTVGTFGSIVHLIGEIIAYTGASSPVCQP